ncbi:MAG: DUF6778 family protein [Pseudomonadota bacterium]
MKLVRSFVLLAAGLALSACATVEPASRNAPLEAAPLDVAAVQQVIKPSFNVQRVNVVVPETLKASEANLYYPLADIVWREDRGGDRHAQVKAIVAQAADLGTAGMTGAQPVSVDIQLDRFHSLTEKARYSVGGVHNILFRMAVRDANTGAFIVAPRQVEASLKAFGGARAIEAEREGQTQKVRIIGHVSQVIAEELAKPIPVVPGLLVSQLDDAPVADAPLR